MLLAIISAILAYRKAKDTDRNPWIWAFIAAATFIGTQIIVAIFLGFAIGVILVMTDRPESDLQIADLASRALAVVFSFVTTWLVLRYLDKHPKENPVNEPPPPPVFDKEA